MDYFKPFFVKIAGRAREGDHTSTHDQIIAPLLQNALAAYVYNGRKDSIVGAFGSVEHPLNLSDFSFLVRKRGKFRLDLARECVNGAEIFWNACSFRRGSVVVLLDGEFDLVPILRRCVEIDIDETPNMSNSPAATKLAKRAMSEGQIAVLFSASNGIEWMDIYAPGAVQEKILKLADEINGVEI
ncbi:hypothetical protein [Campylobacter showae]|uniref:hypothetical protein n=1 Tax=Campylobacter showae TaxID=204 RepID=UPI0028D1A35B|nr:hypothetical protein [Campylobacter showae]